MGGDCAVAHLSRPVLPVLSHTQRPGLPWGSDSTSPRTKACLQPGSLPSAGPQHFGQPLPQAYRMASRSLPDPALPSPPHPPQATNGIPRHQPQKALCCPGRPPEQCPPVSCPGEKAALGEGRVGIRGTDGGPRAGGLEDTPRSGARDLCSHPPALSSAAPPPSPTGQTHRAFRELSRGGEVPDILAATYAPASPLCDPLLGTERKPVLPEGDTASSPTQLLVMGDALPKPHARVSSWGSQQEGLIQAAQVLRLSSHLRDPSAVSQLRISTPKTSHHVGDGGHLALISPSIAASEALETACPGGLSGPAATQSLSRDQSVPAPPKIAALTGSTATATQAGGQRVPEDRPIRSKTWLESILPSRARIDTDLLRARTHVWQSACLPTQAANLPAGHARASVAHRYPNALLTPVYRARGHGECGEAADCARALTREPTASREAGAAGLREWGGRPGRGQDGRGGGSAPPSVAAATTAASRPPPWPELEASPGGGLAPRTRSGGGPGPGGPARGRECRGRLPAPCGSSGPAEAASCPAPRPRVRRRSAASGPGRPGRCGPSTLRAQSIGCPGERRGPGPEGPPEPPPRPHFTDAATEAGEGPEPAGEAGPPNLAASPPGPGSGAERRDAEGGESPFPPPRGSAAGTSALPRDRRRQTPRSSLRAAPAGGAARRLGAFPPASLSASRCPGSGTPRPAPRPPDPGATSLKAAPNKSERAGRKGAGLSAPGSRNARNVRLRGRGAGGGRSGLIGWRPPPLERP
ncbi:collagen alpha-2(I) chain-like [Dama dama]|uniref:collagen alpha-2(I) chain-like n=1 Tax=Dama dama TaxID=30532 RepID=UPI002A3586C8|nr:collagen alpha-2(I) chain-like [Dama dama]